MIPPDDTLNLRMAYLYCEDDVSGGEWVEERCDVWFDHEAIGWRAQVIEPSRWPSYRGISSLGFDPMDAVDQLAHYYANRMRGAKMAHEQTWEQRFTLETDGHRGYGPSFVTNEQAYVLELEYTCQTILSASGMWVAYVEDDEGQVRVGIAETATKAVGELVLDTDPLIRIPGTNVTLPGKYAMVL